MTKLPVLIEIRLRARHWYYNLFKEDYVEEALKCRKGECKACGLCCQVRFFGILQCPFLENGRCRLYGRRMPRSCKVFPFDREDRYGGLIPELEQNCGYYWEE